VLENLIDRLTRLSLRLSWFTVALSVAVIAAGIFALSQLGLELLPSIEFPQSVVIAINPNLDASSMRDEVTIPMEDAVGTVDGVANVESTTSSGFAVLIIRNEFGLDQPALRTELEAALNQVNYPAGMDVPRLLSFSFEDIPLAAVSVSSPGLSVSELKSLVESDISPALESLGLVADVNVSGGQQLPTEPAPTPEPTVGPTAMQPEPPATEVPTEEIVGVPLPDSWVQAGASQNITLETTADLNPQLVAGIGSFAPQLLADLTPEMLLAMSPENLAALPQDFFASLDPELVAQLMAMIPAPVEIPADAPPLSGAWLERPEQAVGPIPTFETAADLLTSGFAPSAAELLNLLLQSGQPQAPQLLADLSLEVVVWLIEQEPEFLFSLSADAMRLLSPEVLGELPDEFLDQLDQSLSAELRALAAGTAVAFLPTDTISRVDGNPSLTLTIFKVGEANTVSAADEVSESLDEILLEHDGLRFEFVFEQASFIEESISGVAREGVLGAVFAVIVILVFLSGVVKQRYRLSWRSTLVIAVSIPLSVFMAFALMRWLPPILTVVFDPLAEATDGLPVLGFLVTALRRLFPVDLTLNIMTLSGMTVAVGRVVDDSIVVLENVYRHIQRGENQRDSVLIGTRDVAIAIFASTATTIVVFLPIGLLGGLVGEFFLPFGVAVTYALASSFLVAVTIVPVLAFLLIRKDHLPSEGETVLQRAYTPILRWSLDNRMATLAIAGVLLIGSMLLLSQRPRAFLPAFGEVQINTSIDLPDGTSMAETDQQVMEFEQMLGEVEGLGSVLTEVGSGGGFEAQLFGGVIDQSRASVQIRVEDPAELNRLTGLVREQAEPIFGQENVAVSSGSLSSGAFGGFALVLSGDVEKIAEIDAEVIRTLDGVEGLANVSSNLGELESFLRVDGEPAVRYTGELETEDALGVTEAAKRALEGMIPAELTLSEGFETQQQTEGFQQSIRAVMISIIAVYIVMVLTFRSFIHPFTILFSLPMAIIGAAAALWLTNRVLSLSAMIGLMMLVGIVVTNAIVLMYRVQANRKKRGMNARDAVLEGARTRLRPILMTAIAAMLALVPLALGLTEGAIIASELATVVIGGLFTSTMLTLLVVPVIYSLLEGLSGKKQTSDQ
jgi:HAE1 family hydrophobic/amphiphilic exporter-1